MENSMNLFEYEITQHSADSFREMVYFCSPEGTCRLESIPRPQLQVMEKLLNERGRKGWELLQVSFGKDGILVFWKRMIIQENE